jgi:hypothetical protein
MTKNKTFIIAGAALAAIIGGSYFLMGGNKDSTSNIDTGYSKGNRIVASNVNPVPSNLKENYFGGKRNKKSKKRKNNRKNKSIKR